MLGLSSFGEAEPFDSEHNGVKKTTMYVVNEDNNGIMDLKSYLSSKSREKASAIMDSIAREMDSGPLDETKRKALTKYLEEINSRVNNLKSLFFLKDHPFIISQVEKVAQTLKDFYFPTQKVKTMAEDNEMSPNRPKQQLQWRGGVASLATLFHELSTKSFFSNKGPNLIATPKQLENFILESFTDEDGEPFSQQSLATYLDPSKPEKKAKRNKIPIDEIGKK